GGGDGGRPMGLTYSLGKMVYNDWSTRTFIGIDNNNRLVVAESMTQKQADALGIRDAVSFQNGNTLITNENDKVTLHYNDDNTGKAQRTTIGQRADGMIIMVVTDGRTAASLGATHNDIIDVMVSYGAVTAGMLDGGSSAMMYYRDWYTKYNVDVSTLDENQRKGMVNKFKAFTPPRYIPTYFMVTTEEGAS
ncbi:MAG: phosphodiester glycosidase family protein, partial [Clostridia bacterium]|nr:phosphodiester glycosidase family protein [Clostridia bacterium]